MKVLVSDNLGDIGIQMFQNEAGIEVDVKTGLAPEELKAVIGPGYEVTAVEVRDALHLKSVCAYLGDGCVVLAPGYIDESVFADYEKIEIGARDTYAANCIAVNGSVIVAEGFPEVVERIVGAGFDTIEIPMSEFCKCDGGLSCLSVRF